MIMNIPRIKKINYNINFVVSYTNQFHRFGTHIFGLFIDCNVFIILREYVDRLISNGIIALQIMV
jgi:hypothetical protein